MVVGEAQNGSVEDAERQQQQHPQPTQHPSINQATIDNIMSGIENTGAVKMNNHRKKLRQRFDIIKKLGQGTYGKVQLGINKETGQEVAIKTIKKSKIETEADLIRIRREVQIMSSVQHPNIIHIYEVFENREKMVLVMEFAAGGELYDYLSERKVLNEEEARRIFRQVSTAIYYCHKHKICHRDLKLENILLDEHGNAKIADFGLSNVFDEQRLLATFCGSPLYASPEIVKGTPYQGPEVDCWSLGVLLYTLVYGAMPFDGANFKRLVKQISQGDYFEPKSPSRASPLIREMLTVCPIRRSNIESICSHWWVNEDYNENCLDLAEELANQTPVRLDVLLSLAPPSVTSEQMVVPSQDDGGKERIQKSHSVGSIIDIVETEAERRILDMVAAGGEAAIMPSPTRTITPQESPMQQPKRKLESTVSTENATGGAKKKEKAISDMIMSDPSKHSIPEVMEVEPETPPITPSNDEDANEPTVPDVQESLKKIEELCDELMEKTDKNKMEEITTEKLKEEEEKIPSTTAIIASPPVEQVKKEAAKKIASPVKRDMVKHKTSDLSGALTSISKDMEQVSPVTSKSQTVVERTNSLPEEPTTPTSTQPPKSTEKRRSRILETAEKFQNMNNQNNEKYKKFSIPGVSVGSFKKEFERKASLTNETPKKTVLPQRTESIENDNEVKKQQQSVATEQKISPPTTITTAAKSKVNTANVSKSNSADKSSSAASSTSKIGDELNANDSRSSVHSATLEEARRSMENSIKLLQKAKAESQSKDIDKLCMRTESVVLDNDREKKLQAAREIIGNAIPPSRLIGIRKPPLYGLHGRSISGGVISPQPTPRPYVGRQVSSSIENNNNNSQVVLEKAQPPEPTADQIKTSHAEITLKSATLPRRKPSGKMEIQVEIKPRVEQQQVPASSETPTTYTSFTVHQNNRSTSVEPQNKEHVINIQKPPTYQRNSSNASYRTSTLSRQSTNDSNDSDTTQPTQSFIQSSSTIGSSMSGGGDKQPIKKSPREFIIPISVEGGGIVTPRVNSSSNSSNIEQQSDSQQRIGRPKRISSIFNDSEEDLTSAAGFSKLNRHTSIGRESDSEEPRFHTMHRLRSSRPTKRSTIFSQDPNESDSGDEDDDDDGFELLTAENLFSTLLSRVRALTHRLNVNNETTSSNFPSTRFMSNLRQTGQSPFWNNDPFTSSNKCTSYRSETITETIKVTSRTNMHPWRTNNLTRDLHSDFDSMFSRSGATLPRGKNTKNDKNNNNNRHEVLDLGDLDLSQLRLTKKDLETLSSITPSLSKNVQDQLLAQLPPNQAKKLSRTLSMQNQTNNVNSNNNSSNNQEIYRRSLSSNPREMINRYCRDSVTPTNEVFDSINNNNTSLINTSLRTTKLKYLIDDSLNNNNSNNHIIRERTISPPPLSDYRDKYYKENISTSNEDIERACFSPPPLKEDSKKTKRYSRVITENNNSEKKSELSTQKILREMRERSIEKNLNHETEGKGNKISYYLDKYATSELNKVLDNGSPIYANIHATQQPTTSAINDKILDELNSISLLNNQLEKYNQLEVKEVKVKRKKSPSVEKSSRVKEKVVESEENVTVEKSRIARPKSFVSKEVPLKPVMSSEKILNEAVDMQPPSKLERPKSFPNSKFTATSKELKKLSDTLENALNESINPENKSNVETEPKKVKKIIKVVKKSTKKLASSESDTQQQPAVMLEVTDSKKEKSPEKKGSKGLLYTLGQKFEKLRDTKTKKEEAIAPHEVTTTTTTTSSSQSSNIDMKEKKKKLKAMLNEDVDEMTRQERKSKIDALIKNLKEKSIPHNTELTESGLIKRAISVEEMPNAFNKNAVNKVLGLFKRIEKENENKTDRVQNTKSTSYLSSIEMSSSVESCSNVNSTSSVSIKERPKSGGFIKRNGSSFEPLANICESKIPVKFTCPDCKTNDTAAAAAAAVVKRHSNDDSVEEKERLKNNRKGLMLDFSRFKSPEPEVGNKAANNYSFPPPHPNDLQVASPQTPTRTLYDNLTNYSSNAFDISASSLSPNDDIAYDGWSTCSDDHATALHHPMGSLSLTRLRSTQSQGHDDPDESVVDRIRRKSFYNRFNEKKAKRVSTIVGPAAKEYYRERSKPLEYTKAATSVIPDLSSSSRASSIEPHSRTTSRYSLASTSAANRSLSQTRPSKYEKSSDLPTTATSSSSSTSYHHRRNDLSSLPPPYHVHHTAHHHHMLTSPIDDITSSSKIKSNRNTMYDSSSSSSTNNTPSLSSLYAKRRSFVSTSGNSSSTTTSHYSSSSLKPPHSFVDSYATIGRKMRQYNTRSVSLLDPSIISSSSGSNSYTNTLHDSHLSSSSHRNHHLNGYGGDGSTATSSRTLRTYARTPSVTRTGDNI